MSRARIALIKIFFLVFALTIIGRDVRLQLASDPRLARLANRQFSAKVTALPRRGVILDRNGEGLAISLKVRSLFFRPELMKNELTGAERNRILFNLARILRVPVNALAAKVRPDKGFVWIKRQLTPEEEQAIRGGGLLEYGDAVGLAEESKRFYPNKELAAHVLGSVGVDGQALEGLELHYDSILNGERVRVSSSRDAMGRKIFRDDKGLLAFKDGQSLVLTLDNAIQYEAEKALRAAIEQHRARAGSVIVAEVTSGEILAMANYPSFNPNNPKASSADARRNRAITDTYEPGSTFKPLVVGLALEKGKSPKTRIYCEKGSFRVGDRRISEAEAHEKFEWLTLGEILKFSSNVGAAKLALELGPAAVTSLIERLGLTKKTGIDLPGEVAGSTDMRELRSPVRLANIGFGHGLTVTPLQILSYYLAIANGGYVVQPKLVKAILAEDPDSLERGTIRWRLGHRFDLIRTKKVMSAQAAKDLTAMLETVVQEKGTGTKAALEEWQVAGKTGTAQKVDPATRKYSKSKYIASFVGFAPSKNPRLVALVVMDEPQGVYYGSEAAAPAFRETMRASLLRERVPSTQPVAATKMSAETVSAVEKEKAAPNELDQPKYNDRQELRMPDLHGMTVREVTRAIGNRGFDVEIIGTGVLKDQNPAPNQWVESGTKVRLLFQQGG